MTQDAVVTKLLPNGMAEVAVTRGTACGGNCGSCESCRFQKELHTEARNLIQAQPGQKVTIESKSSRIFGAALLFFLAGYGLAAALGASEGVKILVSFAALLVSACVLVLSQRLNRNKNPITFDIIA